MQSNRTKALRSMCARRSEPHNLEDSAGNLSESGLAVGGGPRPKHAPASHCAAA